MKALVVNMDGGVVLVILAILVGLYLKFKNSIFAAKDAVLSKEAQKLDTEATEIKSNIMKLKQDLSSSSGAASPENVEAFWSKK